MIYKEIQKSKYLLILLLVNVHIFSIILPIYMISPLHTSLHVHIHTFSQCNTAESWLVGHKLSNKYLHHKKNNVQLK